MRSNLIERIILGVALTVSIVNIVLLVVLFEAGRQVAGAAAQAASIVQEIQSQSSTTPLTANVAIDTTFSVPIKTVVPVKTTVDVPVVIPILGQRVTVTVPIDAEVPIDTTIQVPVKTSVPVHVRLGDTSFGKTLQQVQAWLTDLSARLQVW